MNRIKELRLEKQLTLKELAEEFNEFIDNVKMNIKKTSYSSISRWEKGINEPKLDVWQALANFFSVSVPYLQGIGVSRKEFSEYLVKKYYVDYRKDERTFLFSLLCNYVDKKAFSDAIKKFLDKANIATNDIERYVPYKWGDIPYIDGYMMGRFAFVPILNDYDFLTSINKDELKIDNEDFANRVSKRLFSLIETEKNAYRIYAKEEMMNAMLDAYLEEIKKSILKFKLYGYKYNDKDATLAIFDEIDEITNKYRINTTRLKLEKSK